MTKQELKYLYQTKKISAKEYFLARGKIIQQECASISVTPKNDVDILAIFDGNLPLFSR